MEIFLLFLFFIMMLCGFGLFLWLLFLHQQVTGLSGSIKRLSNLINKYEQEKEALISPPCDEEKKENPPKTSVTQNSNNEPQKQEAPEILASHTPKEEIKPAKTSTLDISKGFYAESKKDTGFDFQSTFLGNIFNKIGAVAIIIATIIFIKLVSPFIVLTPIMKIVLGFLAGCGMIGGALCMHKTEKLKNYSEVLLGTGFAVLFITDYCACSLFHLLNSLTASFIGAALMTVTYFIADKMRTLSVIVIGLIGAYLTPLFVGGDSNMVLSYLIFINMISLIFTLRNKKTNYINIINLITTMIVFNCYNVLSSLNITYPIVLWFIYIIYDLLRDKTNYTDTFLCGVNYVVLTFFSSSIFKESNMALGCMLGSTALIYAVLTGYSRFFKNPLYKIYDYSTLVSVGLFIYFICNDIVSVLSWAIIAFIISCIIMKYKMQHLTGALVGYYLVSFVCALFVRLDGQFCFLTQYTPIFNIRAITFLIPSLLMLTSVVYVLKNSYEKVRNTLIYTGVLLAYLYVIGEINSIFGQISGANYELMTFYKSMLFIITGLVYSLHLKRLSVIFNSIFAEAMSYIALLISVFTLVGLSYVYPEGILPIFNLRFAAYVLAIINCIIFAKWTKLDCYKYFAVILGFFLCHSECAGIARFEEAYTYMISVGWVLYSGITTILGILKDKKYLINTGIVLSILSILRIFIYDLANVDAVYKLIAFLVLGIILMLVSYIYTSFKNKD